VDLESILTIINKIGNEITTIIIIAGIIVWIIKNIQIGD
jgi:hypothetical protein